ncbi:MAG TPA: deoxynucleoside kinase [bacterium]|nr:deoxynucleoside kinase [bacterium]HPN45394.1 deoxynucleoside kinase [bacterium]
MINNGSKTILPFKPPVYIVVAGNIGAGKTTLAEKIADYFQFNAFYESTIHNPYLEDFYRDMNRWSFNLQIYFMTQRFIEQRKIINCERPCVQDRSIYEDVEVFAYILNKQGYLSNDDYNTYRQLFYEIADYLRKPDLIIYLRASVWTLISRIRKRGRDFEQKITSEYLFELHDAYERWIASLRNEFKVLTIDADQLDLDKRPELIYDVYARVQEQIDLYEKS